MTLYEMLRQSTLHAPSSTCLSFSEEVFSYEDLLLAINRLGHHLEEAGVKQGDRVALILPNIPAFVISYFAVTAIGAVAVPINPVWTADELTYVLRDCQPRLIVATPLPAVRAVAGIVPRVLWTAGEQADTWGSFLAEGNTEPLVGTESDADLAVLIYTSGTTGKPKGAMLTHRNLTANTFATREALEVSSSDVFLCVLPLFHCLAATVTMLVPISLGSKIVLVEQFVPKMVLEAISEHQISVLVGVPSLFVVITTSNVPKELLRSVRVCVSGGAPLPVSVLEQFTRGYGMPIREGYGLSEASPVVSVNPPHRIKPGTVGPPLPGVRVRVVDEEDRDLPIGEAGELLVQSEGVMMGYFGLPEATEAALRGGWLHTGDVATIDEDGYVTIVDRLKDMIIVGGLKVYPREVEEVLYAHPKVREVAVVGVSHPLRGESVKAVISLKEGACLTASEITNSCREHLANYKVPRSVVFVDEIPKSSTGKILRRLAAQLSD